MDKDGFDLSPPLLGFFRRSLLLNIISRITGKRRKRAGGVKRHFSLFLSFALCVLELVRFAVE